MSLSLKVILHSPSLDMFGDVDPSSAYSLSGHVSISLNPPFSLFETRHKPTSYLLKSLKLTFEGHTELIIPSIGHSSLRLCNITQDIAPSDPLELSNEGHEDTTCSWEIVFNLPIPGWLAATTAYGVDTGIKYTLDAEAVLVSLNEPSASSPWSLSALCAPFRSKTKTIRASREIMVRRFVDTQFLDSTEIPDTSYSINSRYVQPDHDDLGLQIPEEILSKIKVVASVPEYLDIDSKSVTLTVRLRAEGLEEEHCQRLRLSGFKLDVIQREKCRMQPSDECRRRFPIPPESEQPPNKPLRHGLRGGFLYEGFFLTPSMEQDATHSRDVSLLHSHECGEYKLQGDCSIFAQDSNAETPTWYTFETRIPISSLPHCKWESESEWLGSPKLRATSFSPLLTFRHEIQMSLLCDYELPDNQGTGTGALSFSVPLRFLHVPPPPPVTTPVVPVIIRSQVMQIPIIPDNASSSSLPAYSQLFYSNGDRKLDYNPLPLYTSQETPDASSSSLLDLLENEKTSQHFDSHDDNDATETTPLL